MKPLVLVLPFVAQSLVSSAAPSGERIESQTFSATPEIHLNRDSINKEGILLSECDKRIQKFLKSHDRFTLEELKDLGIPTTDGRTLKLSQIARIEVSFRKIQVQQDKEKTATEAPVAPTPAK